jgi:beta-ribofuranosylaminobenzene 5'-phosphate synthase
MITVQTASRLHFGLLSFPAGSKWPNHLGEMSVPARRFGGAGLMIQAPGSSLRLRPAKEWSAEGPLADRALAFARNFTESVKARGAEVPGSPQHIQVDRIATEHAGLGTGTQLALAVARGLSEAWGLSISPEDLVRHVSRAARSALGFHGFFHGGFLVEAGQTPSTVISPLIARVPFPESWRIVLVIPPWGTGLHGQEESDAFRQLHALPLQQTEKLCRLLLLGLLPALTERDLAAFGEALFDFNHSAGQAFAAIQHGVYAGPRIAELIEFIHRQGIAGVGQSSWGPTVFAIVEDESRGAELARRIRDTFALEENEIIVTTACNQSAVVKVLPD